MIYLDSSVALAYLLAEDKSPAPVLWGENLISSRLLQFEVWARVHARGLTHSHSQLVELLLKRIPLLEMAVPVLARALKPFPKPIRTLDALHLASADFLRSQGEPVTIASYDGRLNEAAQLMGFALADI
ncbi:MAG TPA: PIN domain-containing protein [Thermoanaerobaculia bacterium]|nr:PIN domain-containing protein [Thermoanaerobaculia bacterium]